MGGFWCRHFPEAGTKGEGGDEKADGEAAPDAEGAEGGVAGEEDGGGDAYEPVGDEPDEGGDVDVLQATKH